MQNLPNFFKVSVVRGKIVKVEYSQEQGLEVLLDKLRAHGWLELFANTNWGVLSQIWPNFMRITMSPMLW